MGFNVVHGSPQTIWAPVDNADRSSWETLRVGQLVYCGSDGVLNLGQASGIADLTGEKRPYGVVVGDNNYRPLHDTTYMTNYITAYDPHSNTTETVGVEGPTIKGDSAAYVQIAVIDPCTVLRGQIFNSTYGTAITAGTVTTGSTTGAGFTCSGGLSDASTPVADLGTVYCRTGANAGIYRVTTDTSATVKTVGMYFPRDVAIGDTFVNVQMRPWGESYVQTDAEAMFFDASANPATNYWIINVIRLDLSEAGREYVEFTFSSDHFCKLTTST